MIGLLCGPRVLPFQCTVTAVHTVSEVIYAIYAFECAYYDIEFLERRHCIHILMSNLPVKQN